MSSFFSCQQQLARTCHKRNSFSMVTSDDQGTNWNLRIVCYFPQFWGNWMQCILSWSSLIFLASSVSLSFSQRFPEMVRRGLSTEGATCLVTSRRNTTHSLFSAGFLRLIYQWAWCNSMQCQFPRTVKASLSSRKLVDMRLDILFMATGKEIWEECNLGTSDVMCWKFYCF